MYLGLIGQKENKKIIEELMFKQMKDNLSFNIKDYV